MVMLPRPLHPKAPLFEEDTSWSQKPLGLNPALPHCGQDMLSCLCCVLGSRMNVQSQPTHKGHQLLPRQLLAPVVGAKVGGAQALSSQGGQGRTSKSGPKGEARASQGKKAGEWRREGAAGVGRGLMVQTLRRDSPDLNTLICKVGVSLVLLFYGFEK